MKHLQADPLDRHQFPLDEWALVEAHFDAEQQGLVETLFSVGNGYLGMRGNLEEGRDGYMYGTFVNGFHETWQIRHAEDAFGFAQVGQTIVNVPDAKIIRLYVDDEPFVLSEADVLRGTRRLDFRDGVLYREVEWRTPSGKRVLIRSRRLVSFTDRHLAVIDYEVTMLDAEAHLLVSSQILNRQDGQDEFTDRTEESGATFDPRKAEAFTDRVLLPRIKRIDGSRSLLAYRTNNSRMTLAVGAEHSVETDNDYDETNRLEDDFAEHAYRVHAKPGQPFRLVKNIGYHTSRSVPTRELADRTDRTLDRARDTPLGEVLARQLDWLEDFWKRSDVIVEGQPVLQQAIRWNLFQIAQATARTDGGGIAAKGVSGSGYGGHYFWDTEIYVLPFLTYTAPQVARNALRFRQNMLDAARQRAAELNQHGALFPWRTINGLESSAYYAAGTAQYHIDADISYAINQYVRATGDEDFLVQGGVDVLVETARMWADLGFWRSNGDSHFHIHGVTGPDEYTTVVNDNLFTNVMAKANLRSAVQAVERLRITHPEEFSRMQERLDLQEDEILEWLQAAEAMYLPFDEGLGIHPQDAQFLEKELWDLENTPASKRPLLLHYHPLVIYRFQVLKQADVVLALLLQGQEFTAEEKRRDFEYYDALTTGDSSLSAVVQSIIAAEVGYGALAEQYFTQALFVDIANLHRNTSDGIHVASTGGIWSALTMGFAGMRDHGGRITFDPRLPEGWDALRFPLTLHGSRVRVELRADAIAFEIEEGAGVTVHVRGDQVDLDPARPTSVPLRGQGPHLEGAPTTSDIEGSLRRDGSVITASIPTITIEHVESDLVVD
ncbi:glycoside hydrolase family 65 protein [Arenivirga flava]|uniref:Kojibiose phosphorylase n=1 Tax=Arenivirga flava TaxID=1930060 RepID=A0AA37UL05_9MICO|nr:glycosyl hydrolase family 65 protein [Arenivirga flava]GMA28610.1 kojibiose phosphorylase [Arenivirga flava]